MNQNKFISFFRIVFNPLRLISLFFLYIGYFFGYFADFFDNLLNEINSKLSKTEDSIKNIPIRNKYEKIILIILLICLFTVWYNYLNRGIE